MFKMKNSHNPNKNINRRHHRYLRKKHRHEVPQKQRTNLKWKNKGRRK